MNKVEELWLKEFKQLQAKWTELFDDIETPEADAIMDASHRPPALGRFIAEIQSEIVEGLNDDDLSYLDEEGKVNYVLNKTMNALGFMCVRFYRLGNAMAFHLPHENMTPCRCSSVHDEDLNDLLAGGFPLEGEGWVIQNFVPRKEAQ